MYSKINLSNAKIKKQLKSNEIYFTTLAAVFLSTMAIIVSIKTNDIAKIQIDIAKEQAKIDYFEQLPDFSVKKKSIKVLNKPENDSIEIEIINNSGKFKNLEIQVFGSINVTLLDPSGIHEELKLNLKYQNIILIGSYKIHKKDNSTLSSNVVKKFHAKVDSIEMREITSKIAKEFKRCGFVSFITFNNYIYSEIKYRDFLDEIRIEYYEIFYDGDGSYCKNISQNPRKFIEYPDMQYCINLKKVQDGEIAEICQNIIKFSQTFN